MGRAQAVHDGVKVVLEVNLLFTVHVVVHHLVVLGGLCCGNFDSDLRLGIGATSNGIVFSEPNAHSGIDSTASLVESDVAGVSPWVQVNTVASESVGSLSGLFLVH